MSQSSPVLGSLEPPEGHLEPSPGHLETPVAPDSGSLEFDEKHDPIEVFEKFEQESCDRNELDRVLLSLKKHGASLMDLHVLDSFPLTPLQKLSLIAEMVRQKPPEVLDPEEPI